VARAQGRNSAVTLKHAIGYDDIWADKLDNLRSANEHGLNSLCALLDNTHASYHFDE